MTVRVDTLRNQITAAIELQRKVLAEAEDLHSVAYDRARGLAEAKVRGGTRDYALDTHGDPRARDAYRAIGDTLVVAADQIADACHTAIRILRESDHHPGKRHRRRITGLELASALAAKIRRHQTSDYDSFRALPQPDRDLALAQAQAAFETADQDRKILAAKCAWLEQELANSRAERRSRR